MRIIEELNEFKKEKDQLDQLKFKIINEIHAKLFDMERQGKDPHIIYDTYIVELSEENTIPERKITNLLNEILSESDMLRSDKVTINFRIRMLKCKNCNSRYSEKLRNCPGCGI